MSANARIPLLLITSTLLALGARIGHSLDQSNDLKRLPISNDSAPQCAAEAIFAIPLLPDQPFHKLLSETGLFANLDQLSPAAGLIPYEINASFWSDGSTKRRWISVPPSTKPPIKFAVTGEWDFATGTVFVKHFEMPSLVSTSGTARLETRVLVRGADGGVHGATYRWRADGTDAEIVETAVSGNYTITNKPGEQQELEWYFPGRQNCQACHTPESGGVLGVNARQLNRMISLDGVTSENQLVAWSRMGMFDSPVTSESLSHNSVLAPVDDEHASVERRVRSYLDVNCAMCHRPGIDSGYFDARFDTFLTRQHLIDGPLKINMGIDKARVVAPKDPWRSVLLARISTTDAGTAMPPLGHNRTDTAAVDLVQRWILSMPGEKVLPPPQIRPEGGMYAPWPEVNILHDDPEATIRFTTTGAPPTEQDTVFTDSIKTSGPLTIRARAYKAGMKSSIVVTETFTRP